MMKVDEAVRQACRQPDLVSALTWICVWESERVVKQATNTRYGWDTCFGTCIQSVMDTWDNIGKFGGLCNRKACRGPMAEWYNHSTMKYYCQVCAHTMNEFHQEAAEELFGHGICTHGKK